MTLVPREQLMSLLDREFGAPAFSATAESGPDLLGLTVAGLGPVTFPIRPAQARKLVGLGTAARYGQGTRTLTDTSVRDTWEVPKDAVTVRWGRGFEPVLDELREGLGLASSCVLRAELHSLLVYEKGQFFLPHQDSEKDDTMVGTLVVTLPSQYSGGELVVEQNGTSVRCRGSASGLSFAAFYADCRHEVRPVRSGHRITLTFNLLLDTGTRQPPGAGTALDEAAARLREHFAAPVDKSYLQAPVVPPKRLIYLLDHEYTERSLDWDRLKGGDAARAGLLRAAAEQEGCLVMLALTEVEESWAVSRDGDDGERGENWSEDDWEEQWQDEEGTEYKLHCLVADSTRLVCWFDPVTGRTEKIALDVDDTELCAGKAGPAPYQYEYEGYMGNYGNTLDRWYRRAALVLFPADQEFDNHVEASPDGVMERIGKRALSGDLAGARSDAARLAPIWVAMVKHQGPQADSLDRALRTSRALDHGAAATRFLAPFRVEHLTASVATPLAQLAQRAGGTWTEELLRNWFRDSDLREVRYGGDELAWYSSLPELCKALHNAGANTDATARTLLDLSWQRLLTEARRLWKAATSARRAAGLASLGQPLAPILAAAQLYGSPALCEEIARWLNGLGGLGDEATVWLVPTLRAAAAILAETPSDDGALNRVLDSDFEAIAAERALHLRDRLAHPARAADDWSITESTGCSCDLCDVLTRFLEDRQRRVFEWPLDTQDRRHVHALIDEIGLPVSHETRRKGNPYILLLTKQKKLVDDERATRAQDEADLQWLGVNWPSIAERASGTA